MLESLLAIGRGLGQFCRNGLEVCGAGPGIDLCRRVQVEIAALGQRVINVRDGWLLTIVRLVGTALC